MTIAGRTVGTAINRIRGRSRAIVSRLVTIGSRNRSAPGLGAHYPGAGRSKTAGEAKAAWRVGAIGNGSTVSGAAGVAAVGRVTGRQGRQIDRSA